MQQNIEIKMYLYLFLLMAVGEMGMLNG